MQQNLLHTVAAAAKVVGLPRQTVHQAAKRGEIPVYQTACGFPLVKLGDVKKYVKHRYRPEMARKGG